MKNLNVNVSRETRMVNLPKQFIAVDGENLQSKLVFTFVDEFVNGQARLEIEIQGEKNYIVLEKEGNTYTIPVKNVITKEGQIDMQLVITEGTNEEEIPVFKSNKFYLYCNASINAVDEAPDSYELWIEEANVKLNQIDNVDIDIKTENENTKVVITKKDGTTKEAIVSGGTGTITDVLVDEKSVVKGGIAFIDLTQKVDKIEGKGLSSNDFTDEDKEKLNKSKGNTDVTNNGEQK